MSSVILFRHKNIRLQRANYRGQRWYFVTLSTDSRRRIFTDTVTCTWLIEALRRPADAYQFAIHAYCLMPDHLHLLAFGAGPGSDLLAFVKHFKQATSLEFQERFQRILWQKKFYDHILRKRDPAERVAAYIWMNPVRKGICASPDEYAFSGSFVRDWRKEASRVIAWTPSWKISPKAQPPLRGSVLR